jgi:hypothetical protein
MKKILLLGLAFQSLHSHSQIKWQNVDSLYQPLPPSVHVYFTNQPMDSSPFKAYYLVADLNDKKLEFTVDTGRDRRLTPSVFYERNGKALAVVNCTFFSFETNRSLNTVIKEGNILAFNNRKVRGRGADSIVFYRPHMSAIGISRKREPDIAWVQADSTARNPQVIQTPPVKKTGAEEPNNFRKWNVETAVGGGPVLVQEGQVKITNEEEMMFMGRTINDKHPRTAMGYTQDGKLVILVVEGRNKEASGATLGQEARIFQELGCWEALNLDGGGSSCLLVNGKSTIRVSDALGQRPVPAVFVIRTK